MLKLKFQRRSSFDRHQLVGVSLRDFQVGPLRRFLSELRLAASFLTILPLGVGESVPTDLVGCSYAWFPFIGFLLGGALVIEDFCLSPLFKTSFRSLLIVISLAFVTGCVHLDGLADSADALGAWSNRMRALEIMRDSRIGVFGAVALTSVMMLKWGAISSLDGNRRHLALYVAPGLSRWAMVVVSQGLKYLRSEGAGTDLLAGPSAVFVRAQFLSALALIPAVSLDTLVAFIIVAVFAMLVKVFYRRQFGGITGDLLGAVVELSEVIALVVFCAADRVFRS